MARKFISSAQAPRLRHDLALMLSACPRDTGAND
jgi:hypothetical protein